MAPACDIFRLLNPRLCAVFMGAQQTVYKKPARAALVRVVFRQGLTVSPLAGGRCRLARPQGASRDQTFGRSLLLCALWRCESLHPLLWSLPSTCLSCQNQRLVATVLPLV